ncbi:MAG: AtpZ/AtpI family protein [Candidatus Zixiibacteriota bacterium]|nr:MAG: AtpZ/AtpI family protein [candidate division Zixibacteria bacterium]
MLKRKDDKSAGYRQIGFLTLIPIIMVVAPLLGYFLGSFLDEKLGTEPYLMIEIIGFGFGAAGKEVYELIKRSAKEE